MIFSAILFVISQIPPPTGYIPPPKVPSWYDVAALKKPTAVFVGVTAREVKGMVACRQDNFPGVLGPCVIVSLLYADGQMWQHATLSANATDAEIRRAAGLEVRASALSFRQSSDNCPT